MGTTLHFAGQKVVLSLFMFKDDLKVSV